jgi:glycosyltransferase involved in cell wall biosynthesis
MNEADPTLSILTPVRSGGCEYLEAAWQSLAGQVVDGGFEWLLQEDGERPTDALQELAASDPRVSYGFNGAPPQGPSVTRNMALARARGQLIRTLDADDLLPEGCLEPCAEKLLADRELGYVVGPAVDLLPDGRRVEFPRVIEAGEIAPGTLLEAWVERGGKGAVHPAGLMARLDLVLALGGWMGLPGGGDTGLLLSLSQISRGWQMENDVLIYRKHDDQFSDSTWTRGEIARSQRHRLIRRRAEALAGQLLPPTQGVPKK